MKQIAYVGLAGTGGINVNKIPVKDIKFGDSGICVIEDTNGVTFATHISNVLYMEKKTDEE